MAHAQSGRKITRKRSNTREKVSGSKKTPKKKARKKTSPQNKVQRILFLPGLGADREMYRALESALLKANITYQATYYANGPAAHAYESLATYTLRSFRQQDLHGKSFDVIFACSFGGMVIQEALAQNLIKTKRLVLLSTAIRGSDLSWLARVFDHAISFLPVICYPWLVNILKAIYPIIRKSFKDAPRMAEMFAKVDPVFFCTAAKQLIRPWRKAIEQADLNKILVQSFPENTQIFHGTNDPVISHKKVQISLGSAFNIDHLMTGENHILALTRPEKIVQLIQNKSV